MSDDVTPERVVAIAAAARIPISAAAAARVAGGTSPTAARFRAAEVDVPLEAEPSTYLVVAQKEIAS